MLLLIVPLKMAYLPNKVYQKLTKSLKRAAKLDSKLTGGRRANTSNNRNLSMANSARNSLAYGLSSVGACPSSIMAPSSGAHAPSSGADRRLTMSSLTNSGAF